MNKSIRYTTLITLFSLSLTTIAVGSDKKTSPSNQSFLDGISLGRFSDQGGSPYAAPSGSHPRPAPENYEAEIAGLIPKLQAEIAADTTQLETDQANFAKLDKELRAYKTTDRMLTNLAISEGVLLWLYGSKKINSTLAQDVNKSTLGGIAVQGFGATSAGAGLFFDGVHGLVKHDVRSQLEQKRQEVNKRIVRLNVAKQQLERLQQRQGQKLSYSNPKFVSALKAKDLAEDAAKALEIRNSQDEALLATVESKIKEAQNYHTLPGGAAFTAGAIWTGADFINRGSLLGPLPGAKGFAKEAGKNVVKAALLGVGGAEFLLGGKDMIQLTSLQSKLKADIDASRTGAGKNRADAEAYGAYLNELQGNK